MPLFIHRVAVFFNSHTGLKDGTPDGCQFAAVLASNGADACLVAAQLVAAAHDVVPTGTTLLD